MLTPAGLIARTSRLLTPRVLAPLLAPAGLVATPMLPLVAPVLRLTMPIYIARMLQRCMPVLRPIAAARRLVMPGALRLSTPVRLVASAVVQTLWLVWPMLPLIKLPVPRCISVPAVAVPAHWLNRSTQWLVAPPRCRPHSLGGRYSRLQRGSREASRRPTSRWSTLAIFFIGGAGARRACIETALPYASADVRGPTLTSQHSLLRSELWLPAARRRRRRFF